VLDPAIGQLGWRGGGGELFALEKGSRYHVAVSSGVAHQLPGEPKVSQVVVLSGEELKRRGEEMARRVLQRSSSTGWSIFVGTMARMM
jgi:hypothetical protein